MQILYSFGLNDDGQCGVGTTESVTIPYPVKFPYNKKIKQISSGSRHTLILTECGEVYSFGWGGAGQLGHGNTNSLTTPKKIDFLPSKIRSISAGGMHSACIDSLNQLYTWGSNTYGQLGYPNISNELNFSEVVYSSPNLVLMSTNEPFLVKEVSCGGMHTLAISASDDCLYSWGRSDCGQTGFSDWYLNQTPNLYTPYLVKTSKNIVLRPIGIKCSGFFSLILNHDGLVYAMGKEDYGCLGTCITSSTNSIGVETPTLVSSLKNVKITQISALGWHSCFLDDQGCLYVTGKGEYGRLGLGNESSKLNPVQVEKTQEIEDLLKNNSSTTSSVTSSDTSASATSSSPFSNACTPLHPNDTKMAKILEVSAGGSHTIWRDERNQVFTVGRNDDGRCGYTLRKLNDRAVVLGNNITYRFFSTQSDADKYTYKISSVVAGGSNSYVLVEYEPKEVSGTPEEQLNELYKNINEYYKNLRK